MARPRRPWPRHVCQEVHDTPYLRRSLGTKPGHGLAGGSVTEKATISYPSFGAPMALVASEPGQPLQATDTIVSPNWLRYGMNFSYGNDRAEMRYSLQQLRFATHYFTE